MKNVLFISIDDLMNVVRFRNAYGTPFKTPNIDRLLDQGVYFDSAHALVAECNPSRTAVLTGQSLFRTGVEDNTQDLLDHVKPETTLPYLFRTSGYETAAVGKVFHRYPIKLEEGSDKFVFFTSMFDVLHRSHGEGNDESSNFLDGIGPTHRDESEMRDTEAATWAADYISGQSGDDPWFLAVGLLKPHLDWHVPKQYYKLYDTSKIVAPSDTDWDPDSLPLFFQQFLQPGAHKKILAAESWEKAIRAYMAAVSYVDAQLGKLLDAMDEAGAWDNTTVILWSDHGYHLGDQQAWGKFTHWEHGTNAPLIIVDPDIGSPGTTVNTPVSLLDIFPTLVDLAGIDDRLAPRDGHSLVPLMRDPEAHWQHFAGTVMDGSVSIRTEHFRYIASLDGSEQVYDMLRDPDQTHNLALETGHHALLQHLRGRAAAELAEIGGHIDLTHRTVHGNRDDEAFMVTANIDRAEGGRGDDLYVALDPDAIVERAGGGDDRLIVYAPSRDVEVRANIPRHVERIELATTAHGTLRGSASDDVLVGANRADRLIGGRGADVLDGQDGGDRIAGDAGDDTLAGGKGRDRLTGGRSDDVLSGGDGADWLDGGPGRNVLTGGSGADTFATHNLHGQNRIEDFRPGTDTIDLRAIGLGSFRDLVRETAADGSAVVRIPGHDVRIVLDGVGWNEIGPSDFLI